MIAVSAGADNPSAALRQGRRISHRLHAPPSIIARYRKTRQLLQRVSILRGWQPVYSLDGHPRLRLGLPSGVLKRAAALNSRHDVRQFRESAILYRLTNEGCLVGAAMLH